MRQRALIRRIGVLAVAGSLLIMGTLPATAVSGDDGYPTWEQVRAAQGSEEAAAAEYARLQEALGRAQTEADTAAADAATAEAAATTAKRQLRDAERREAELRERASEAQLRLDGNSEELGRMVSWLYTNGTGLASTSQLTLAENPEEFMTKLSTVTQVSGTWNTLAEQAAVELNSAASLEDQAESATRERARLAQAAEKAAAAAAEAQSAATAAVESATGRSDTLYEQLAVLRGTTAEIERQYQTGLRVGQQGVNEPGGSGGSGGGSVGSGSGGSGGGSGGSGAGGSGGETGGGSGGSGGGSGGGAVTVDPAGAQAYARSSLGAYGWGDDQFPCLVSLWNGESNWRADALNPWSGAYGIPQALPAEKMAAAGPDWRTNGNTQVNWGLAYIQGVYGSPCAAWNTWQARNPHWY